MREQHSVFADKFIQFEQMLSCSPQVGPKGHGAEPCIRALIHKYYAAHFDGPRAKALADEYVHSLFKMLD